MMQVKNIVQGAGGAWRAMVYVDGRRAGEALRLGQHEPIRVPVGVDPDDVARQVAVGLDMRRIRRQCRRWTMYLVPGDEKVRVVHRQYSHHIRDQLVGQYGSDVTILNEEL